MTGSFENAHGFDLMFYVDKFHCLLAEMVAELRPIWVKLLCKLCAHTHTHTQLLEKFREMLGNEETLEFVAQIIEINCLLANYITPLFASAYS